MVESLGKRIRGLRSHRGLTLKEVADALELTPAAISHWESGRITPKGRKLQELARVLTVTVADLRGSGSSSGRPATPMAEISEILSDAKKRIADIMGCEPEDVELEWRIK